MKLSRRFYLNHDVVETAKKLLGKAVCTNFKDRYCSAYIIETEAYAGITDKASHAFGGRFTNRTSVMFAKGGVAYVYLCYGIHSLFNVVTGPAGVPHAVLVRGVLMHEEKYSLNGRGQISNSNSPVISGPGNVTRILGIHYSHSGTCLTGDQVWLEDRKVAIPDSAIIKSPRIGVDYAGKDADLPYRFRVDMNNPVWMKLQERGNF